MNNLKKFATEADYSAATLNYPAVSWVVSGDTVHFDKGAAPVANDKVMLYSYTESSTEDLVLYNSASSPATPYFTSITVNDTEVEYPNADNVLEDVGTGTYLIKYGLTSNEIDEWFTGDLGGFGSGTQPAEVFYPSWVTSIGGNYPSNASVIVCEATTPPSIEGLSSTFPNNIDVYVPDSVVNTYKADVGWGETSSTIYPISQYSGNLPI